MHLRVTKHRFASNFMKTVLLAALAAAVFCIPAFTQTVTVTVTGKKTTYTRPRPLADFKKTFTVNHPRVKAATPALSRKIERLISHQTVFDLNIREEIREIQWLEEADFEVIYNANGILTVKLWISGTGAYPSGSISVVVVDVKRGIKITPAMVFTDLRGLAAMIRNDQQNEIAEAIKQIKNDPELEEPNPEELFEGKEFQIKDLERFSVNRSGVTFTYDYGFPHVIQALAPEGEYTYSWDRLRPFIKPTGLLARLAR
jgi:hypothetical protein